MRCYNGAWDSQALALFKQQDDLMAAIRHYEPDAHCTRFPSEGTFQVHRWGHPLSGFHGSKVAALQSALSRLQQIVWC
jgi:hypothetical protein